MNNRLEPKPPFFVALGDFNQALSAKDFAGVSDRRLLDRLKAGAPLCHDTVHRLMLPISSVSISVRSKRRRNTSPPVDPDEAAAELSSWCISRFRDYVKEQMVTPRKAWDELEKLLSKPFADRDWTKSEIEQFREVLVELHTWTGDEIQAMKAGHSTQPMVKALFQLSGGWKD